MKYHEIDLNGEIVKLRLTSNAICEIEKKTNKSILDLIKEITQTNVISFLMYMRRFEVPNFSTKEANDLYDRFIDNGYSMQDILFDVIYECLVISGVMTKGELEQLREITQTREKKVKERIEEITQE